MLLETYFHILDLWILLNLLLEIVEKIYIVCLFIVLLDLTIVLVFLVQTFLIYYIIIFGFFFCFNRLNLHFIFSYTKIANSILFLNIFFSKKLISLFNPKLSTNFITKFKTSNYIFAFLACFLVYPTFSLNIFYLNNIYYLYRFYKLSGRLKTFKLVSYNSTNVVSHLLFNYIFYFVLVSLQSIYKFFIYLICV